MNFTRGRSGLGGRPVNRQLKSSAAADRLPFVALACICCAFLFLAASTAWGQSAGNGFTLQQVMSSPFPSNLVAAKHAPRVAWIFNAKGVRNIWVADAPDFLARQVTHYAIDGQPLASLRLTPDGRTAVYVRGSETNRHGEVAGPDSPVVRPHQEVWAVDAQGGEPRRLGAMECDEEECEDVELSPDGQYAVWAARDQLWVAPVSGAQPAQLLAYAHGNNHDPRWSPDGQEIAFVSSRGDHNLIAIYNFQRANLRYLAPSTDRDDLPRWSRDGKYIAWVRLAGLQRGLPVIPIRPEPWAIWVADAANGVARQVWVSGNDENSSLPRLTEAISFDFAAGNRITFASEQDGWNHLYSVPLAGGPATLLTPGPSEVEDVALSPDGSQILYTSNQNDIDRRHIWRVAVAGGAPQAITRSDTIEWSPVQLEGGQIVALGSSATTPAMPYRITPVGRTMIAAQAMPADFPSAQLVTPKQVVFKSEDGWNIPGQLFVPRGHTAPGPAVIFLHGGSMRQMMLGFHNMNYYHNAYAENQYLVSRGYVVLSVNYRTGIMYGRAFRVPRDGGWRGAAEYKDVVAGANYLRSLPYVDAKRIGLWGGSYGGYLTAMGLARNSDLFAAGVDLHGVHDWSVFLDRWMQMTDQPNAAPPDLAEAKKLAFESSPNASVDKWKSPVLLIQGDDDRNVPFSQMVDLVQRLRADHVPFEELVFPDEIHDFLKWASWIQAYEAAADFFDRELKQAGRTATPGRPR